MVLHHFANQGPYSQSYGLSSSYVCIWDLDKESWTPTKELMLSTCGAGKFLRVPWTARGSNQSTLKEINPEYSLEGLLLKLKFQYFGHLMRRAYSLEKILKLGKIESRKRREWKRMRWVGQQHQLNGHEFAQTPGDSEGQGGLACCSPWVAESWTQLSHWTTTALYVPSMLPRLSGGLILKGKSVGL